MLTQTRRNTQARSIRYAALIGAIIGLVGCTSTADQYIENGSGYQLGLYDGQRGEEARSVAQIRAYEKIQQTAYDEGYEQGVKDYCNPDHAYQIGLSGNDYQGICENMEDGQKFRMEWQRGWRHYQLTNQ